MVDFQRKDFSSLQITQAWEEFERTKFYNPFKANGAAIVTILSNGLRICLTDLIVSSGTTVTVKRQDGTVTYLDLDFVNSLELEFTQPMIFEMGEDIKIESALGKIYVAGFFSAI